MGLRENTFKEEYRTGDIDLVEVFYRPCLKKSVRYDRAVGYFRSSVFLLVGPDFLEFAKKGGKLRLVCSPCLSSDDADAITQGYKSKEEVTSETILKDIDQILENHAITKNTEALATLICLGAIEIKLTFLPEAQGIYHEKIGLFYDTDGDVISIKGSINETWNGWSERGNYENLDVFCSWMKGRDTRQVERNKKYFQSLWNGEVKGLEVVDFPNVAKDKLKLYAKKSLEDLDPLDLVDYFNVGRKVTTKEYNEQGGIAKKRKPLPHQLKAIYSWEEQGKRGIFEHATGSGKTFTALTALKKHLGEDGVALVLVPDRLLHKQWSEEIKEELPEVTILKAGDGHNRWRKNRRLRKFTQPGKGLGQRIVLATMQTARLTDFQAGIWQGDHLMVVADEVHEIGSAENAKTMSIHTGPRLGLSATPKRYGDPLGTYKIFEYFGKIVEPPFTLIDAINQGRLVEYEYHPAPLRLTSEESDAWETATKEISQEYARSKRDDNGSPIVSPRLQNMMIQRSRIAKKASAKVPYALSIIVDHYIEGQSWLIYCEDQYQLGEVIDNLRAKGYSPCEYHTNMTGDAAASLDWFKRFGGIMVSIRCLDQGVDIPKISHAIILASSQNPRQFIQRRGRVLRVCPGKTHAVIYDAVVVPICLEQEPGQLSLLKSELQRSIQFSDTAMNRSGSNKLISIAIDLGIDPEEIGLVDTDGIEEPGDNDDD
jgi:superfamily II DNA or RNA helicase